MLTNSAEEAKKEDLRKIIEIQTGLLKNRLTEKDIELILSGGAKDFFIKTGYNPDFGARPIKRAIQQYIETPIAKLMVEGKLMKNSKAFLKLSMIILSLI